MPQMKQLTVTLIPLHGAATWRIQCCLFGNYATPYDIVYSETFM